MTNALLRVWVSDSATVWVNGKKTKPQQLAGVYEGSRIFSLTDLTPGKAHEAVVKVKHGTSEYQERRIAVKAGEFYPVRFDAPEEKAAPANPAVEPANPAVEQANAIQAAKEAEAARDKAKQAQTAAEQARDAAEDFKKAAEDASRQSEAILADANEAKNAAAQSAIQSARSNSEEFSFENDHKSIVAWVTYKTPNNAPELAFDANSTPKTLVFHETTGALKNLSGVKIMLNYYITIEVPDTTAPSGYRKEVTCPPYRQPTIFNAGTATVKFFDADQPSKHLSAKFKTQLEKKWSRTYKDGRVKVEIRAILPNGGETSVAPVGNRLTIEVTESP